MCKNMATQTLCLQLDSTNHFSQSLKLKNGTSISHIRHTRISIYSSCHMHNISITIHYNLRIPFLPFVCSKKEAYAAITQAFWHPIISLCFSMCYSRNQLTTKPPKCVLIVRVVCGYKAICRIFIIYTDICCK